MCLLLSQLHGVDVSGLVFLPESVLTLIDCKTLAPVWEKVASDFASEPNVLIAKVDCEAPNAKAVAEKSIPWLCSSCSLRH